MENPVPKPHTPLFPRIALVLCMVLTAAMPALAAPVVELMASAYGRSSDELMILSFALHPVLISLCGIVVIGLWKHTTVAFAYTTALACFSNYRLFIVHENTHPLVRAAVLSVPFVVLFAGQWCVIRHLRAQTRRAS